jgi:hypothetical protein
MLATEEDALLLAQESFADTKEVIGDGWIFGELALADKHSCALGDHHVESFLENMIKL